MAKYAVLCMAALAMVVLPARAAQHRPLRVTFVNENPAYVNSNVFVMFRTPEAYTHLFAAWYSGGPIALTTSYSLAQLGGEVSLSNTVSGNIIISLGTPMKVPTTNDAGQLPWPSPGNYTDGDYSTRWDMVEVTYQGDPADVSDLTGINMFGIPFQLKTWHGTTNRQTTGYMVDGDTMVAKLVAAATDSSAKLTDGTSRFLRVLGPTAYAFGHIGPYPSLTSYVDSVRASGLPTHISDWFSGPAGGVDRYASQRYMFTTTFTNLAGVDQLIMLGGGEVIGTNHAVTIVYSNVAYQAYANDPQYMIDHTTPGVIGNNDVYAAAVRDVLAGLACGFIGSTATDQVTHVEFRHEASSNWFAEAQTQAFSDVQATVPRYNGYGEVFWRYSTVYGFPFADRLPKKVQANLNPSDVDTLEIIVQDDTVPEPLALTPLLLVLLRIRRRIA